MTATQAAPSYEGHYVGIVTRTASFAIDVLAIGLIFSLAGTVLEYLLTIVLGRDVTLADTPLQSSLAIAAWAFLYFAYPLAVSGRTFGMAVLGTRVVRADGRPLGTRHAVVRTLALPLSFLLAGFGFLLIVLRRDRCALHDLIADAAVVYAWDARAARVRFLTRE